MSEQNTLEQWLSVLTRLGYDPDGVQAYTSRGDWNTNHPINNLTMCFRLAGRPDIVLSSYSCYGAVQRTTYARVCWPTNKRSKYSHHMAFGFEVVGSDKTERTARNTKELEEMYVLKRPPAQLTKEQEEERA